MNQLFPPILPYSEGYLSVSELHTLYFQQAGNPQGKPVLVLHGGPGSGISGEHKQFFDPLFYQIIVFDQRGAGKSTPFAELEENTSWDLVSDIEKLRKHLNIENWLIFGGSWGSTLALFYAILHPERVRGMILRGIFLGTKWENDWLYADSGCAAMVFPEKWEYFKEIIPENEQENLIKAYYVRLTSTDPAVQLEAAQRWAHWEAVTARLIPDANLVEKFSKPQKAIALARLECHYFHHDLFLPDPNFILDNCIKVGHLPSLIVHGRYDMICPAAAAYCLHQKLKNSTLKIVADAGHSCMEHGILHELIQASEDFKKLW